MEARSFCYLPEGTLRCIQRPGATKSKQHSQALAEQGPEWIPEETVNWGAQAGTWSGAWQRWGSAVVPSSNNNKPNLGPRVLSLPIRSQSVR